MATYTCDTCEQAFDGEPKADAYTCHGQRYGLCPDCERSRRDGLIRTVAQLEKMGSYAWPGGYPLVFFPPGDGGIFLCFDCAKTDLESGDGPLDSETEDGDQKFYGGVSCGGCGRYIVEPECPECMDTLFDGSPLMQADNVDAPAMHRRCAAKLVCNGLLDHKRRLRHAEPNAIRVPGIGVRIHEAPWYAPAGTIYRYVR